MSEIEELRRVLRVAEEKFGEVKSEIDRMEENLKSEFQEVLERHQSTQVEMEYLDDFFREPYVMLPKRGHEWYVVVPKFLKMQVGYLEHSTKSYNVFVVNKYVQWLGEIPEKLQSRLKFPKPFPFKVFDGVLLTGSEFQDYAWNRYKRFLVGRKGKDRIRVKKGYEFKLIAKIIEDGTLPFIPKPVEEEDLRLWNGVGRERYLQVCDENNVSDLQDKAWNRFLEYGAIGLYWAFGAGKSLFGHRIIGRLKGPKLVVVPSLTLKEQWLERLEYFNPDSVEEVRVETYRSYHKVKDTEWTVTVFDECQHLPANTFIKLATLQTKYRIGFSGSPFREDGRENYIFALTGFPVGMAWEDLLKLDVIHAPRFRVYILKDKREKDRKLAELLRLPLKTVIFCDWRDYGEQLSRKFEIPFVHGGTTDRLEIIRNSQVCVVSRVGDEGLSIPDLERVIEVAFLFGSRMQESQRFGRLMHGEEEAEHIILMTQKEFDKYQKRLRAIIERGFKIEYIR